MTHPVADHVSDLIAFGQRWDREAPLLIHCYAGISRSTAGAYITALRSIRSLTRVLLAQSLRRNAPSATPNSRLVALADDMLGRKGRMVDAIKAIGRGEEAFEGTPFILPLDGVDMTGTPNAVEINLSAAIVAVANNDPLILTTPSGDDTERDELPFGPFNPLQHRTFETGLREWVAEQTPLRLGYVEQLYTFGDRGRHKTAEDRDLHIVSVGYLALTRIRTTTRRRCANPARAGAAGIRSCLGRTGASASPP